MKNLNLIDVEASGLHFDAYPIEIAILANGAIHSWLIKPEPAWTYWSADAEAMHGISRDLLLREGLPPALVAENINRILQDSTGIVYSDAAQWDEDWVNTLFAVANAARQFHILPIQDLLDEPQTFTFQKAMKELGATGANRRHRAAWDVALICQAYLAVDRSAG